ncbi:DUF4124 domain-containing protein [Pseudomonas cichorii]|nr:DUF4124 domain-containing protein [Pseudomonas cichorii]MBX8512784.1 DUF4124 domain-containing protein [Pseudomonas cichorii]MBX8522058.1 DUF4124 domain-containing protein [Pseudomonas cichorii]MBX8527813.1 DUF4124 domain-containing protein [Pseudomonas cichorii]MBX8572525.1 DUF4124 domain-containing protein [Pseudomonas cichorii]MBX8592762.1 DUF4124 domain-containing protein [Pseudomonas cichorii]
MKWPSLALAAAALNFTGTAHSEIFKCTSPEGHVSFASIPCAEGDVNSSLQRQGPPKMLRQGEPVDHAHKVNLKATEYLKVSGRAKVTVYETESYKQYQRDRPPPPTAVSQCKSPRYDSQCFDPSGGYSSKKVGK